MIPLQLIKKYADADPGAVVFKGRDVRITWNEFRVETEKRILFLLNHYGRSMPQQASYIARNRADLLPWLSALATLGVPVTGLDYTLPTARLKTMNETIGSELVIISSKTVCHDHHCTISLAKPDAMLIDLDSVAILFLNVLGDSNADIADRLASYQLPTRPYRAVGFTSGTSSAPKPVLRDTPFDQRRFAYFTERFGFSGADRFLSIMPIYHAAGNGWVRLFLSLGALIYIDNYDSPTELKRVLETERITASVMAPIMLSELVNAYPETARSALPSLRWLLIGGNHLPPSLKLSALSVLGPCLHEYYGTTETGVNTLAGPADMLSHPGSVGLAYDGNSVLVVDQDGCPVGANESGTVVIDSYMNMRGYANSETAELTIDGRRYLVTPEQGYLDAEGRLFLLNRTQQSGNLTPIYRLEDAIRTLPHVGDVAILPMAQGTVGGLTCALSLKHGCQNESNLIHEVRQLAALEAVTLDQCAVIPAIPYSPSGKVRVGDISSLLARM